MPFIFDKDDKTHLDKESEISYNYYDADINDSDISIETSDKSVGGLFGSNSNPFANKNIVINYFNQPNKPNLTYPDYSMKYSGKVMRFFGLLHNNIKGVTCDSNGMPLSNNIVGELVIEQTSITGYDKVFTCFLLKNLKDVNPNSLDRVIKQYELPEEEKKKTLKINLNDIIKNSNCITYKDGTNSVIVFTSPIDINTAGDIISKYSKSTSLFNIAPSDSKSYKNINESSKVGGTDKTNIGQKKDDDIYIDCTPTGEKADKIATYNVPINSEYTSDAGKLNFMKTTIHLCMVIMFLILVYFLVPIFYKGVIIDNINKFVQPKQGVYPNEEDKIADNMTIDGVRKKIVNTFIRIRSVDVTLTAIFLSIFVVLIYEGYSVKDNFDMIMYALYFAIMFGLSFATIQFNKNSNEFMRTKVKAENNRAELRGGLYPDELQDKSPVNFFQIGDVIMFLGLALLYVFTGKKGYVFLTLIFLAALTLFILMICYWFKKIESFSKVLYIFFIVCMAGLLPTVPTAILCSEDPNFW
jgi:hypothetical protein